MRDVRATVRPAFLFSSAAAVRGASEETSLIQNEPCAHATAQRAIRRKANNAQYAANTVIRLLPPICLAPETALNARARHAVRVRQQAEWRDIPARACSIKELMRKRFAASARYAPPHEIENARAKPRGRRRRQRNAALRYVLFLKGSAYSSKVLQLQVLCRRATRVCGTRRAIGRARASVCSPQRRKYRPPIIIKISWQYASRHVAHVHVFCYGSGSLLFLPAA